MGAEKALVATKPYHHEKHQLSRVSLSIIAAWLLAIAFGIGFLDTSNTTFS